MRKTKILLLSGANNHDWARSAPFCRDLLEAGGDFEVTLCLEPSATLEDRRALDEYDLLFVDYNGPMWSEVARHNFAEAVRAGAGVTLLHAADNAFDGWADYERMCGLIWRGKRGSGHGDFGPMQVEFTAPHPATEGLAPFQTEDELYHGMIEVPGACFEVLATSFSDLARGGTGRDEPVMLASSFGSGRVFHLLLGHLWKGDPDGAYRGASLVALENEGFKSSLLRGCAWAARR